MYSEGSFPGLHPGLSPTAGRWERKNNPQVFTFPSRDNMFFDWRKNYLSPWVLGACGWSHCCHCYQQEIPFLLFPSELEWFLLEPCLSMPMPTSGFQAALSPGKGTQEREQKGANQPPIQLSSKSGLLSQTTYYYMLFRVLKWLFLAFYKFFSCIQWEGQGRWWLIHFTHSQNQWRYSFFIGVNAIYNVFLWGFVLHAGIP